MALRLHRELIYEDFALLAEARKTTVPKVITEALTQRLKQVTPKQYVPKTDFFRYYAGVSHNTPGQPRVEQHAGPLMSIYLTADQQEIIQEITRILQEQIPQKHIKAGDTVAMLLWDWLEEQ